MESFGSCNTLTVHNHKTSHKFACKFVLKEDLSGNLKTWFQGRCAFLFEMTGSCHDFDHNYVFCDLKGEQLPSNEVARICRVHISGTPSDMRKAHYYLVRFIICMTFISSVISLSPVKRTPMAFQLRNLMPWLPSFATIQAQPSSIMTLLGLQKML